VEALRRRIAADLHDDIGASLSRVAVLTEVVKRQVGPEQREPIRRLGEIADTARNLIDAMSDIVWSIDPRRDDLNNVVLRVREFASDVLEGDSIAWELQASEGLEKIKLDPEQRRQLFLIFKEALTNIARHSGARSAALVLQANARGIQAEIRDQGCGFNPCAVSGHGLENMRARIMRLGGDITVDTAQGSGTRITLTVPLKPGAPRKNSRA
jgi:signal transduction histidine kinase